MLLCSGFNVYPREIDQVFYTNQRLAPYKAPKIVEFIEQLPTVKKA